MMRLVQEDSGEGWAAVPFNRETGEACKPERVNGHMVVVIDDYTALCSVAFGEWSSTRCGVQVGKKNGSTMNCRVW